MMTRLATAPRGRAGLIRRLEALEKWREQQPPPSSEWMDLTVLPAELLKKLAVVTEWLKAHGPDALLDEHHAMLAEISEFYRSLEAQGADTHDQSRRVAA